MEETNIMEYFSEQFNKNIKKKCDDIIKKYKTKLESGELFFSESIYIDTELKGLVIFNTYKLVLIELSNKGFKCYYEESDKYFRYIVSLQEICNLLGWNKLS